MTRRKELTIRERRLIIGIAAGLTVSQAARRAGYSENTIDDRIHEILGRSRVKMAIDQIMDSLGISNERLAEALNAGLEATKFVPVGNSEDLGCKAYVEVPDFIIRHRFLETVLYLKGFLSNKRQQKNKSK